MDTLWCTFCASMVLMNLCRTWRISFLCLTVEYFSRLSMGQNFDVTKMQRQVKGVDNASLTFLPAYSRQYWLTLHERAIIENRYQHRSREIDSRSHEPIFVFVLSRADVLSISVIFKVSSRKDRKKEAGKVAGNIFLIGTRRHSHRSSIFPNATNFLSATVKRWKIQ